jgi:type II secretory pathway pseudopilin PulG
MAVVVVSVLMTAILPMVVLSTSARVQARRTELASQAARGFVDGVRSGVIDITSSGTSFPFIDSRDLKSSGTQNQYFSNVPAPSNSNLASLTAIQGIRIDGNGNGFSVNDPQDFVVQPMRSSGADVTTQGFYMQLRVYRADAFQNNNLSAIKSGLTLQTETSCPSSRQAFSNSGGSLVCPVVVVKLDVYPSTSTLDQIKSRL